MKDKVGYAVVILGKNKEIRLTRRFTSFNAEAEAINTAISIIRNTNQQEGDSQRFTELPHRMG
jgi:hypothetical protein